MKERSIVTGLFVMLLAAAGAYSGITRHDVPEEEYLVLARQSQFDCVGRVFNDTNKLASCVLIGNRYVLSAAHVFIDVETTPDTLMMDGHQVISFNVVKEWIIPVEQLRLEFGGKSYGVKNLTLHPAYLDEATKGSCDLAVIELDEAVRDVTPAVLNTLPDELHSFVVGAGYGVSGPADRPALVGEHGKKIAGENVIDSIGGAMIAGRGSLLLCDFDHPDNAACNRMGDSTALRLEYMSGGGDSGGGLFRMKDKQWELVGICHGSSTEIQRLLTTGYYGQVMMWTRVSVFHEWIRAEQR